MRFRYRRPAFTLIELLVVIAVISVLISLLLPAVQSTRESARRLQCANNLAQIGIAIHSYEDTYRVLPPGVVNPSGPIVDAPAGYHFGWIVRILPYMEQKAAYRAFDFDLPIYHPRNFTARSIEVNSLLCPSDPRSPRGFAGGVTPAGLPTFAMFAEAGRSNYAACHHDVEAPIDADNAGVFFLNSRVRYDDIEDGLAQTIFVGEKSVLPGNLGWASGTRASLRNTGSKINAPASGLSPDGGQPEGPENGADPDSAGPPASRPNIVGGFGGFHPNGANFGFGDGSVRFLKNSIDPLVYRRLGGRADGEPVGSDQF